MAVGAALLSATSAFAQQQDDPVERSVQRLKDQLTLTDEQVTKVRDIVKKERDDVKAVLTDAQKTTYDQGGRGTRPGGNNPGNGNGNGNGNNFAGIRGGAWLPATNDLKTQLSLTDDQVTKINEFRDAVRQEMRTFFQNRGRNNGGGQNLADQYNAFQEKSKEETTKKIREILTDEQKPKFEEALKTFAASQPAPGAFGGFGQNRGTLDDRVTRVMENLKIEDAKEADAVKGLVHKVMEAMDKLDTHQRETRTKVDELAKNKDLSDTAVGEKIEEILKTNKELEKDLAGTRKALTEVVTNRQELELIRRGILR